MKAKKTLISHYRSALRRGDYEVAQFCWRLLVNKENTLTVFEAGKPNMYYFSLFGWVFDLNSEMIDRGHIRFYIGGTK